MSNDLSAAIRIGEIPPKVRNVQAAATSTLSVLGIFEKGPVGVPTFTSGPEDLKRVFGGMIAAGVGAKIMRNFYDNGGKLAYVTRVTHLTDVTDPETYSGVAAFKMIDDRLPNAGQKATGSIKVANNAIEEWTQAEGTIEIINNTFDAGDKVTIAGEDFEQGVDWTPGGTAVLSAIALRNAINLSGPLTGVVTAAIDGGNPARVVVTSVVFGTAGNAITLAETDGATDNFTLSGATLLGGVNGDSVTVDAVTYKFGDNVAVGLNAAATASNLNTLINGQVNVNSTIDASDSSKVNIEAAVVGTSGNSLVLTKSDADNDLTLSAGGTLTGGTNPEALNSIQVDAADGVGTHANGRIIRIGSPRNGAADHFKITVLNALGTAVLDVFDDLNLSPASANYVETRVNGKGQKLISVVDQESSNTSPLNLPAIGDHLLAGGDDGLVGLADTDFIGDPAGKTGIYALEKIEDRFSLLSLADRETVLVQQAGRQYAETKKTFLFLEDTEAGKTPQEVVDDKRTNGVSSEWSALYWPRLIMTDQTPGNVGVEINVPNSGAIAGIMARTDNAPGKGVAKTPAGINDGKIFGIVRLESEETQESGTRDLLFPEGINPLWSDQGVGPHVDGGRLTKLDGLVADVAPRRVFIFVETSVKVFLKFAKHENIDEKLSNAANRGITAFLTRLWRQGGLKGKVATEGFYVDAALGAGTINPPSEQEANRFNVEVGLAVKKPAYFVTATFTVDQRDLLAELGQ